MPQETIDFIVGAEKGLADLLREAEILPLLQGAVAAGARAAAVLDESGAPLWMAGDERALERGGAPVPKVSAPLELEGEPVGAMALWWADGDERLPRTVLHVLAGAVAGLLGSNLKRMLTTEIHTRVVNQSYEELLETNRRLALSEKRYRDLAENLEIRVRRRTEELRRASVRMIQQEKMAALGQLAAGMAHEINNPLGFVMSNLGTLRRYVDRLAEMLEFYRRSWQEVAVSPMLAEATERKWRDLKLDLVLGDACELLQQSLAGAERVKEIVADLRGFSHIDDPGTRSVDLHAEIDRTLKVLAREAPPGTSIVKEYGTSAAVVGQPALFGQLFLNILRNAFQSRGEGLEVRVGTVAEAGEVRLIFADNGPGMTEKVRRRVFEPFFTTREVGQGKGLGLSVAYDIVTGLGGTIAVESRPGAGATFIVRLPSRGEEDVGIR